MRTQYDGSSLIRDAIAVLLRRLDAAAPGDDAQNIRAQARSFLMQARDWERLRPTPAEREGLLRGVLTLYMAAAKLERLWGQFGVFDAFADDAGRKAHLDGPIASALAAKAGELFAEPPRIQPVDLLASKLAK